LHNVNPWVSLSLKSLQVGIEAQSVIALRMLRLAAGGARMKAEVRRLATEKALAAAEAQAAAAVASMKGRKKHAIVAKALGVYKKRVRANRRRLSRR
jgi:hypothetical protein